MDMQKEREAFKAWFEKEYLGIDDLANQGDEGAITRRDYAYVGWQAAKAQTVPENKKFNLDEFLVMEEKLKSKGSVIAADLDRFIAYTESVLSQAKALKEPK